MADLKDLFKQGAGLDPSAIGTLKLRFDPNLTQRVAGPLFEQEERELQENLNELLSNRMSTTLSSPLGPTETSQEPKDDELSTQGGD